MWTVVKFGGSSITKDGFEVIKEKIENLGNGKKILIVLSAIKNITNNLLDTIAGNNKIDLIKKIHLNLIKELNLDPNIIIQLLDDLACNKIENNRKVITYGELLSTTILSEYLKYNNINNKLINAGKLILAEENYLHNDEIFLNCKYNTDIDLLISDQQHNVFITQGFFGSTNTNEPCLLGRGGSDTSASLLASSLNADKLEIWTDVNGIYTADPNLINNAKIINNIGYEQAQELAAMGAKVMHPYSIIPCQKKNIPIFIKNTYNSSSVNNTIIYKNELINNKLYAITNQNNVTIFNIISPNMWNNYGFVYDIFSIFSDNSVDINIITTSQFMISATTDDNNLNKLERIKNKLEEKYEVTLQKNCSIVSIVGDEIKIQPYLPEAIQISKKYKDIYMIHYSANNLSLSFVIDTLNAESLLKELHKKLIGNEEPNNDNKFIKTKWWYNKIDKISDLMKNYSSLYLYDLNNIEQKINILKKINKIDKIFYAMKANHHQNIIKKMAENNLGFECVSLQEVQYLREKLNINNSILFTPNFCSINEYITAMKYDNLIVIVDNLEVIKENINVFKNKEIAIRIDLNNGEGHHSNVITEGKKAKFGCPYHQIINDLDLFLENNVKIIGLHSHRGSGINNYKNWITTTKKLLDIAKYFNNIEWIDLGGGFGVDDENPIDFVKLNDELNNIKTDIKIFIEPGRYLVSEGGILLSKVNQIKKKENFSYLGLDTGMNSLIRPSLYGAYHKIHNITKINEERSRIYNIVGPICETGDIIGSNRLLPISEINDIILIENTGAYGYVMSSNYNMRSPAEEIII